MGTRRRRWAVAVRAARGFRFAGALAFCGAGIRRGGDGVFAAGRLNGALGVSIRLGRSAPRAFRFCLRGHSHWAVVAAMGLAAGAFRGGGSARLGACRHGRR